METNFVSPGYEKEVRKHLEDAVSFTRNIKRADDTLKSLKRCLGERVEKHNISFDVLGLFDVSPSIMVHIKALDKNMYLNSLLDEAAYAGSQDSDELEKWKEHVQTRNESIREENLAKSDANIELCFSILGRIHGYFCITWKMGSNTKYYSYFAGKMYDDKDGVSILVNFEGALSAEYTVITKPIPENEVIKEATEEVSVCEVGWTAPQGFDK